MGLKGLRNFLFWSLVILYLFLAPSITFHALGYVFEPKSLSFVKTGIISIHSEPQNANVFLNGRLFSQKTPVAMTRLIPGRYSLEISSPNYQTWHEDFDVRGEEVTRAEHILLVPEKPVFSNQVPSPVHALVPSAGERFLFLVSHEEGKILLNAFDLKKKKLVPLLSESDPDGNHIHALEIVSSRDDRRLILKLEGKESPIYISALISEKPEIRNLSEVISGYISKVRIHPKDSDKIYCLKDKELRVLDLKEPSVKETILLKDVLDFEAIEDKIYHTTSGGFLFSTDLDGKQKKNLLSDETLRHRLFEDEKLDLTRMFLTENENAFWLNQNGTLLTNRLPYFLDENVTGARLVGDSKKLVYWKSRELWLLDLTVSEKEESFLERGPNKVLLWKSNRPIMSAQMMKNGYHALVSTNEAIFLLDLQGSIPVGRNQFMIEKFHKKNKSKTSFYFNDDSGDLYLKDFSEDGKASLLRMKLAESSLFSFPFHFRRSYSPPIRIEVNS